MLSAMHNPVILFDGYCNLCSASVVFILKRERGDSFRFASLQSEYAAKLLSSLNIREKVPDSIVLIENKRYFTRSTAALYILKKLRMPWPLFYILTFIPRFLRDPLYDTIARYRYKWFGKRKKCFMPNKDVRYKFLDQD